MTRYIDADKLLDEVKTESGCIDFSMTATDIRKMIREQPTADVFEKDLLTDRPCAVCKYNATEKGCTQWNCAFGI